jgi:hypothetical protein
MLELVNQELLFKKIFITGFQMRNNMKNFFYKKISSDKKGFALLFSILVSVMVLAVGTSIINIALKQVILSGAGRESQFAFYAANTGLECALFWDLNGSNLNEDTGVPEYVFPPAGQPGVRIPDFGSLECSGTNIATGESIHAGQEYTSDWVIEGDSTTFRIAVSNNIEDTSNILYCAEVTVAKRLVSNGDTSDAYTRITSQGLNTCDPEGDNRAVQRGIVLEYRS